MFRFWELLRCSGVDEEANPSPGMVVPLGGSNLVLLETDGLNLRSRPKSKSTAIEVKEIDGTEIRKKLIEKNIEVNQPGVDRQYMESMLPTSMFWYNKPRFFLIRGRGEVPFKAGAEVHAVSDGGTAKLKVVVLKEAKVKTAIHNIVFVDHDGKIVPHEKPPAAPERERDIMNALWRPQANISFDLVSNRTIVVDSRDPSIRMKFARALGLSNPNGIEIPPKQIDPAKLGGFFKDLAPASGALCTIFVVDKLIGLKGGTTTAQGIFVSSYKRVETTFAHEAGHFFRHRLGITDHTWPANERELMQEGGGGWKITWKVAEQARKSLDLTK